MITCKHQNKLLGPLLIFSGCQTFFAPVSYGDMSYPQAACGGLFSGPPRCVWIPLDRAALLLLFVLILM